MTMRTYKAGETVFRAGDPSDTVFVIRSGMAEVFALDGGRSVWLASLRAGETFGEMGVVQGRPHDASVRAAEELTVEAIDRATFLAELDRAPGAAMPLVRALIARLRDTDRRVTHEAGIAAPLKWGVLRIFSYGGRLDRALPKAGLEVRALPFAVGRQRRHGEDVAVHQVDLMLPDEAPFQLSRAHFAIEDSPDGPMVRDLGSHNGTFVNGTGLGQGQRHMLARLIEGPNEVVAGTLHSPFRFKIAVETA